MTKQNLTPGNEDINIKFQVRQEADFSDIPKADRDECLRDVDFVMYDDHIDYTHLEYEIVEAKLEGDNAIRTIEILVSLPWNDRESFIEAFEDDFIRGQEGEAFGIDLDCLIAYGFDGFDMFGYEEDTIVWEKNILSSSTNSKRIYLINDETVIWEE